MSRWLRMLVISPQLPYGYEPGALAMSLIIAVVGTIIGFGFTIIVEYVPSVELLHPYLIVILSVSVFFTWRGWEVNDAGPIGLGALFVYAAVEVSDTEFGHRLVLGAIGLGLILRFFSVGPVLSFARPKRSSKARSKVEKGKEKKRPP